MSNSTCISERAITTKEPTHIANTVILLIARYMFVAGNRVYSRAEVTIGETIEIGGCDYGVKAAVIHTGSFEYGHYFTVIKTAHEYLCVTCIRYTVVSINWSVYTCIRYTVILFQLLCILVLGTL